MFQMSMDSPRFPTTSQGSGRRVQLQKGERYLVLVLTCETTAKNSYEIPLIMSMDGI